MNKIAEHTISFNGEEKSYRLTRLDDSKYYELWQNSLSIQDDYGFYLSFYAFLEREGENLNLAQVYVTLKQISGESSKFFDDWKGSFSFPFLLEVIKPENKFDYLLDIYDCRGSLYFGIRRYLKQHETYDTNLMYKPFNNEFLREEINGFIVHLYGYFMGRFEVIKDNYSEAFFKKIDSNIILFGYQDGFFENNYNSYEEYQQAVHLLEGDRGLRD